MKLMRNFEEGEKEARALRQRAAGQEQLAAEKEAVQASSEAHSLVILLSHFAFLLCFLNLLSQLDCIKWSPSKIQI